jgi:integrase
MKDVADKYLQYRKGTYYYRRKVPGHLVAKVGKPVIQFSLETKNLTEARKKRDHQNVLYNEVFDQAEYADAPASSIAAQPRVSAARLEEAVRRYVASKHEGFQSWRIQTRPTGDELSDSIEDTEIQLEILTNADDPRSDEQIYFGGEKILASFGLAWDDVPKDKASNFAELVRRGLIEIVRRELDTFAAKFERRFHDNVFDPSRKPSLLFDELADEYQRNTIEEARANKRSEKWIDKTIAHVAFAKEVIGDKKLVEQIDYDECLRFRNLLAKVPNNKNKLHPDLSLEEASERGRHDGKSPLAPSTQSRYLDVFRKILELAVLKQLISTNPAASLRPLRQDTVRAQDKRLPFDLGQIQSFFSSEFYKQCAPKHNSPYTKPDRDWRFWMPLFTLFMGMRPNEICQLQPSDVKRTEKGTWYVDIVATTDDDEFLVTGKPSKTLKTDTSRRKIPIHPELIKVGFLDFAIAPKSAKSDRLFKNLKPDQYGNFATYPLKRFNEVYLPDAIEMKRAQSFYSFRHSFRDALRENKAGPDTLKALGGWSQGNVTSDSYGDNTNPDLHAESVAKIKFGNLDLSFLYKLGSGEDNHNSEVSTAKKESSA